MTTYQNYLDQLSLEIDYYISTCVASFSVFSSYVIIIIYRSKKLKKQSMSFYYVSQTVVDLIFLWSRFAYFSLFSNHLFTTISCQLYCITVYGSSISHSYLILIATFDRFMFIIYPTRLPFIRKTWFQWVMVAGIVVSTIGFGIPDGLNTSYSSDDGYCNIFDYQLYNIYSWLLLVFNCVIPSCIMLFCSIRIITMFKKSKQRLMHLNHRHNVNRMEKKFAASILTVNFMYIAGTFIKYSAQGVFSIAAHYYYDYIAEHYGEFYFMRDFCGALYVIATYGTPFFIHFFTNKIFKATCIGRFQETFKCFKKKPTAELPTSQTV